ncbi:GDP-mannose mannosyl hydrolase [Raoultella terrigena]|uniref:GDP-mannose mannosyl hydrolase n=1 Tax=Raoultella terrigena TaxID=577 RepID=UPI0015B8DDD1|nr:GDP-mannose mannosyl hydrolase [Raoultella terrigena]
MTRVFLDDSIFKTIVEHAPLISIDLIIENSNSEILLGERVNRPARGYLFVPGGRIRKDETINEAFIRLTQLELGIAQSLSSAKFLSVYQHFYDDNFSGSDFSTHYIVLGYKLFLNNDELKLPVEQHSSYSWIPKADILNHPKVHDYTKDYFRTTS